MDFKIGTWLAYKNGVIDAGIWQIVEEKTSERGTKSTLIRKNGCPVNLARTWYETRTLPVFFRLLTPMEVIVNEIDLND